jgi:hypothetical protein
MKAAAPPEGASILLWLWDLPERIDCHFTIEKTHSSEDRLSIFETARIAVNPDEIKSIDELVSRLSQEVEGIEVRRSRKNAKIVHLVESSLAEYKDYVMNKTLDFKYSGKVEGLATALGNRLEAIGPRRSGFNTDLFYDHITTVEIDVKMESVREILSQAVPLKNYKRIIWRTDTATDRRPATVVQFYGPKTISRQDYKTKDD